MSYRLGVDAGGTFTDLALYDVEADHLEFAKTPSTPSDPTLAVADGFRQLTTKLGLVPASVDFFIHGTTVAINALLERKGARTALITTSGFRDVLQIGRQDRPSLYDWRIRRPEPLVPRHLRFEVLERVLHTGKVLIPLDIKLLTPVIELIKKAKVDAVAVCLLHSYANPSHEQTIGTELAKAMPDATITLSSDVLPEFKEYDRMSTTAINSYISPGTARYLRALRDRVREVGLDASVHIMQSNGGVTGAETAAKYPVRTILSGPAAGVIGGVALASLARQSNVITVDMGGTSFDISLAYNGILRHTQESEIEGFPVKVPMVDIHSLGAGGGSLAWIDSGGALRVGPISAGSNPGPACYGNGGVEPTVTDANLILGRLSATAFLGGEMNLDVERARAAVHDRIAVPLGLDLNEAAEGMIRVVNATMVKGIRVVSVAKGYEPREFCMVAFGGAGPAHASELARELDIPNVLVPIAPGVTSALGLLMTDMRHDYVRTVLRLAEESAHKELGRQYMEMESEALQQMSREAISKKQVTLLRVADARYLGQGFELEVPVRGGNLESQHITSLVEQFHEAHRKRYGYGNPDNPVEIVNLRIAAIVSLPRPQFRAASTNPVPATSVKLGSREVYFDGQPVSTDIYNRSLLHSGHVIQGPAIIEQLDTTTVVWPNQTARVDAYANLMLSRNGT